MKKEPGIAVKWSLEAPQTLDARLEPLRRAWEEAGHRGAVLDALRICRHTLPPWLADAVEASLESWSRGDRSTSQGRGRHARRATDRREHVRHLAREEFYLMQCANGLAPEDARAMTADWFGKSERTISNSLARAKRMKPGERYLGPDDRSEQWWYRVFNSPNLAEELRRLQELSDQYRPRPKTR